ncbi:MAG: bifunctional folylpolyglutamate synthase/dihydrofolate synthase [Candidatus Binatia bacterium]
MSSSEYADVLASLYSLEAARGMDFKLERVALALKNLGDPHRRFSAVHVAGTNGKGSVAAMLHAIFTAAGYHVGLYTSPHLLSFTERIRVGTATISEEEVVASAREIRAAATVHGIDLTFFEFVTVMAFLHFARCGVELAIVEVGLGGRLDATNVLNPEVAVITTIGLDHQEFLGDTLASVAREKAGIIKPRRPVIVGVVQPEVEEIFRAVATEQRAPLYRAECDFSLRGSTPFRFTGMGWDLSNLRVALRGSYQRDNAAMAIASAIQLRHRFPLGGEAIRRGLDQVRWPGRLEIVQDRPVVVLDGAHNLHGVMALARELPNVVGKRAVHLLFGVMRDKDWQPMVDTLGPLISSATVATALPPRGEAAETLARAFARHCPVRIAPEPLAGLEALLDHVGEDEGVLVTGSLFLVGAIYPYFLRLHGKRDLFSGNAATLHP